MTTTLVAASAVETEYWTKNQTRQPIPPFWIPVLRPEKVARALLNALARRRAVLVLPAGMQLLRALHYLIPGWVDRVMQRLTALTRKQVDQRRAQLY